jgi:NADPH:quinone reductase-like Zn-dependent oxidoreductase
VQDVDVVLDTIGGETTRRSMQIVKPGGIVVSLLEQPPQDLAKALDIRAMKNTAALPFPSTNLLQTIAQLIAEDQIKATIMQTFPLYQADQAHTLSQQGHGRGRIVLRVTPPR